MILIAAVNENWGIGKNNELLYHIPKDMAFFRNKTENNVIIIGRKTLESFPDKKPLKNRVNIVLSKDSQYNANDCIVVNSVDGLLKKINEYKDKDIYVCGGESIYKLLEPFCDKAYITKVYDNKEFDKCFPNLDCSSAWKVTEESDEIIDNGLKIKFFTYERI